MYDYVICEDGKTIAVEYMGITGAPNNIKWHSEDYSMEMLRMFGRKMAVFIDARYNNLIQQYKSSRQTPS